jgi:hypothetical protein
MNEDRIDSTQISIAGDGGDAWTVTIPELS